MIYMTIRASSKHRKFMTIVSAKTNNTAVSQRICHYKACVVVCTGKQRISGGWGDGGGYGGTPYDGL